MNRATRSRATALRAERVHRSKLTSWTVSRSRRNAEGMRLLVRSRRETHVIPVTEIRVITGAGNYVHVHLAQERILARASIRSLARQLGDQFLRVNRSALVNLSRIVQFSEKLGHGQFGVHTDTGLVVTTGREYTPRVRRALLGGPAAS